MPAKTTIFNYRGVATHSYPLAPRNTIVFSPHGRFVVVAGFGNLAGQMDIFDLEKSHQKITTIEGSNATVCEWAPDGKHILTATTSPRLRVDNGVRIWHFSGALQYNEDLNELYQVCWRPQGSVESPLGDPFHPLPTPHASALDYLAKRKTPSKPVGAYRPPGARGQTTSLAFKREDEGGAAFSREAGSAFGAASINGFGKPRRREIPGAEPAEYVPPGAAPGGGVALPPGAEVTDEKLSKSAAKNKKKREAKKAKEIADKEGGAPELAPPGNGSQHLTPSPDRRERGSHQRHRSKSRNRNRAESNVNGTKAKQQQQQQQAAPVPAPAPAPAPPVAVVPPESPINNISQDKRIRGLLKKLRAIDELKMRLAGGEKLEDTQMKKIHTEESVRKELDGLDYAG
jgi:translation initiation factor 2A